jgi:hypothetical protein
MTPRTQSLLSGHQVYLALAFLGGGELAKFKYRGRLVVLNTFISKVQQQVTIQKAGSLFPTDDEIRYTYTDGPLLTRITMTNQLELPMFAVTLQRSTIDIEGEGQLTVGRLPDDIKETDLTWVPVRLYNASEGGLRAPNFAPNEVYPL